MNYSPRGITEFLRLSHLRTVPGTGSRPPPKSQAAEAMISNLFRELVRIKRKKKNKKIKEGRQSSKPGDTVREQDR